MFKKSETDFHTPETNPIVPRPAQPEPRREGATIGPSISIKGDLTGEEDLLIQGRVEGRVDLKMNSVTVGRNGRVKADIFGKVIGIEGEVIGNLFGQESIVIRQSGNVQGNIASPRVTLEDGCKFKGSIDMEPRSADRSRTSATTGPEVRARADVPPRSEPTGDTSPKPITPRTEPSTTRA